MIHRYIGFILPVWMSSLLVACGVTVTPAQPTPAPATAVVTLRVAGVEEYRIRLVDPDVNAGYSWHIDPASVEFADMATEVCDGRPSDVEKRVITSDRYCPWSAKVVAIAPAQSYWSTEQRGARVDARSLVQMRHPVEHK